MTPPPAGFDPAPIIAIAALGVVGTGVVGGITKRMVVFRDQDDILISFAWCVSVFAFYLLFTASLEDGAWMGLVLSLGFIGPAAIWLTVVLIRRALLDNGGRRLTALLAVATKLPLGVLFVLQVLSALAPTGKTAAQRASNRHWALFLLVLLTPLLYALTRDKESFGRLRLPQLR